MQEVAPQKPFFNSENCFHAHQVSIFSQQASQLMTLMRPAPFFFLKRKEIKMGKTENFKRKLSLVVYLSIVINQEIRRKNNFNCDFFSTPLPVHQMTFKLG